MRLIFRVENGSRWPPGIAAKGARSEKLVVVPIPRPRIGIESTDVESQPPTTIAHVLLKGWALCCWGCIVQENYDLIIGKISGVKKTPVRGSFVGEIVLCCELLKPGISFLYKVDVRCVPGAVIESDDFEAWLSVGITGDLEEHQAERDRLRNPEKFFN